MTCSRLQSVAELLPTSVNSTSQTDLKPVFITSSPVPAPKAHAQHRSPEPLLWSPRRSPYISWSPSVSISPSLETNSLPGWSVSNVNQVTVPPH